MNKEYLEYRKYRVSATAMPNPEKERAKARMVHTLAEAQASRKASTNNDKDENTTKQRGPKVLKKPPRNFGGGKLGDK